MKIAILGAESTGKSQLAAELASALRGQGNTVALVGEYLREWCDHHGRTPRADEQAPIAHEQVRRVEAAVARVDAADAPLPASSDIASHVANPLSNHVVLADTTALLTAAYSELLFNDVSLHDVAIAHQRGYDITLVAGLDLPWVADGLQRDGPHTREAADSLLRALLGRASVGYQVVYGHGPARLENALIAIKSISTYSHRTRATALFSSEKAEKKAVWAWPCEKCSDPDCEHRLFSQLLR